MAEKKEGTKNLAELEGILMPRFVENLGKRAKVREVEITYKVTLTLDEVRRCPFLAGLGTLPKDPEEAMRSTELHDAIAEILKRKKLLSNREKQVIRLRFGIGCPEHSTFKEIGERLGITPSCVSQHYHKALKKLWRVRGKLAAFLVE